ncbi:MAG: hypothetical protein O2943_05920 [Actinomycetota bacterium]|nr:hypothetical protein [Actinomycetota bacterium]
MTALTLATGSRVSNSYPVYKVCLAAKVLVPARLCEASNFPRELYAFTWYALK